MQRKQRVDWGTALVYGYAASIAAFYAFVARRTRAVESRTGATTTVHTRNPGSAGKHDASHEELPFVSIIVPARDEERNIRTSVESLLAQDYPNFAVIVVDDGSTDATPQILDDIASQHPCGYRLRVLRVETLPNGWAGKPHALHTGARIARGSWLLFTDADTCHAPTALRTALRIALAHSDDLLSLGTRQELPDFWGRVIMPLVYMGISMMYPPRQVNDPHSKVAIANGQFILLRRATYDQIGGYGSPALRATVLDDRDLAQAVKHSGGRLEMVDGRDLVQTRMYRNLGEHWQGWGKNAYAGSRGGLPFYLLMIVGLPMTCILPFALLLAGLLGHRRNWTVAGGASVVATIAYRTEVNRGLGVPWRYVWTHPLAATVFTGVLVRSLWRVVTGRGVVWRGRTVKV